MTGAKSNTVKCAWIARRTVSRASGAGLCGVGSIALSGQKGSNDLLEHNIIAGMENSSIINCRK